MAKKAGTLQEKMEEARAVKERAAIRKALAAYLRTKYLPTDARPKPFQMDCDGSPVREKTIQQVVDDLEAEAEELQDQYDVITGETI